MTEYFSSASSCFSDGSWKEMVFGGGGGGCAQHSLHEKVDQVNFLKDLVLYTIVLFKLCLIQFIFLNVHTCSQSAILPQEPLWVYSTGCIRSLWCQDSYLYALPLVNLLPPTIHSSGHLGQCFKFLWICIWVICYHPLTTLLSNLPRVPFLN